MDYIMAAILYIAQTYEMNVIIIPIIEKLKIPNGWDTDECIKYDTIKIVECYDKFGINSDSESENSDTNIDIKSENNNNEYESNNSKDKPIIKKVKIEDNSRNFSISVNDISNTDEGNILENLSDDEPLDYSYDY